MIWFNKLFLINDLVFCSKRTSEWLPWAILASVNNHFKFCLCRRKFQILSSIRIFDLSFQIHFVDQMLTEISKIFDEFHFRWLKSNVENLPIFIDTNNYHASKDQHWQNNDFCRVFAWIIFMYRKHRLLDHSLIKKFQSCKGFDFQLTWSIVMFMHFMRF